MAEVANSYSNTAITVADSFLLLIDANSDIAIKTQGFSVNHEFIIDGLIDPTFLNPPNAQRIF